MLFLVPEKDVKSSHHWDSIGTICDRNESGNTLIDCRGPWERRERKRELGKEKKEKRKKMRGCERM